MQQSVRKYVKDFAAIHAVVYACVISLVFVALSSRTPVFDSFEFWTSDWRTALFSERKEAAHPRIAVVLIDEESLTGLPYRSPIDRGFLSEVVEELDKVGAKVIGLDLFFDQPTEPAKDRRLIETLRKAKTPLILGAHDEHARALSRQIDYNRTFIAETRRPAASLALRLESDGVVRWRAERPTSGAPLFAEALASTAGAAEAKGSQRIAWLRTPEREETFLLIYARDLLPRMSVLPAERRQSLLGALKDRVVIIGGALEDRRDAFVTPLSKTSGDLMLGPVVHAQITAQILDGRAYKSLPPYAAFIMVWLTAFLGFALGWRFYRLNTLTGVTPLLLYAVLDAIAFTQFGVILPAAMPAIGWILGVLLGRSWRYWPQRLQARRNNMERSDAGQPKLST